MTGQAFYNFLLILYPKPFRMRFGEEMLRLYRDCYPDCGAVRLWIEALKDIAVSVPREWRREFSRDDNFIDYTGLIDGFMCTVVAGTLLLGWGVLGATFVRRFGPAAGLSFILATLAIALVVGVLSTFAAARSGRIDTTCSLLITCEKTTARYSR